MSMLLGDAFKKAIELGAVIAMEHHVYSHSRWHRFSVSFYSTSTPDNAGLVDEVGVWSSDMQSFTPLSRKADVRFLKTDPVVFDAYSNDEYSDKMLFIKSHSFDRTLAAHREAVVDNEDSGLSF